MDRLKLEDLIYLQKKLSLIHKALIFLTILVIISLMNPHIEWSDKSYRKTINTDLFKRIKYTDGCGYATGKIINTESLTYSCTAGVKVDDGRNCHTETMGIPGVYGCCPYIAFTNYGSCVLQYTKNTWSLKWF